MLSAFIHFVLTQIQSYKAPPNHEICRPIFLLPFLSPLHPCPGPEPRCLALGRVKGQVSNFQLSHASAFYLKKKKRLGQLKPLGCSLSVF